MTTRCEPRPAATDLLAPVASASALAHLGAAAGAVERLMADADRSDPNYFVLVLTGQSIASARRALSESAGR